MSADAPSSRRRSPAVAGAFYPGGAARLRALAASLLDDSEARFPSPAGPPGQAPVGLLVPHAGLEYSGVVAAAAWRTLQGRIAEPRPSRPPLTVVLLGTNHRAGWLDGIGAWDRGAWSTPLGDVDVDARLAARVVGLGPPFSVDLEAHLEEHSLEVQLPLLQRVAPTARVVPLAVSGGTGGVAIDAGHRLGGLLATSIAEGARVVLAISTDMAHYPRARDAEKVTSDLESVIRDGDPARLAAAERTLRGAGVPGLACGMCGIEPAVVGLAALQAMGACRATALAAATSADAGGPVDRTVGYLAMRFD